MNAPLPAVAPGLPALSMNEEQLIQVLENSLYPGANPNSIALVINYCKASQLDPMQKPVHIVPIWDSKARCMRDVIMPGIGLYRTQAARSGCLAGLSEPEFGNDVTEDIGGVQITYPKDCRVTVKRKLPDGTIAEFTAREFWKENYAVKGGQDKSIAPNAMWTRRPYAQLAKCAQAQALRIAFPEIGSQPTADEMEGKTLNEEYAGTTIDGATGEVVGKAQKATPPYPHEDFQKNLPAWAGLIQSGKKTPDQIIAMVSTKGLLSDEQKAEIRAAADPAPPTGEMTETEIKEARAKELAEANQ
ncbi:MAG: phage recombination protein Bet [Betaproteobacteria bacterium]|nr:phage recombination protein Bet [Betaproteobacteria bacterium]